MMREAFEEILKLADDHTYSHAARMASIKRIVIKAMADIDAAAKKAVTGGTKAGNSVPKQDPPPPGSVVI